VLASSLRGYRRERLSGDAVVLDATGMSDIGPTGTIVLHSVLDDLDHRPVRLVMARAGDRVRPSRDR
jgi:hypothetical protein